MECNKNRNASWCNCTYPCSSKGICCECLRNHRLNGELPACYFPSDAEKTYDRSIEYFVSLYQKRGAWWN
ncbi:MAG: DUF6485 family protein [Bacteroidales bacterium]|nr:DUF6485 family protein [Bacteroidales bacterium]HQK38279.1 DUF6485 family protein [Bacteroidales bacterium]